MAIDKEKKKKYQKKYYYENRERILERKRIYGQLPRNKLTKLNWNRAYRLKFRDKYINYTKNYHLNRKFGIGIAEYQLLLVKQNGNCAICGRHRNSQKYPLGVDHCHKTGKVRALLCTSCNTFLGLYEKNKLRLNEFDKYLESFG